MMLCTIEADLSRAPILNHPTIKGSFFVEYSVILLFGMTEFKAQISWTENVSRLHMLFKPTDIEFIIIY